MLNLEEMPLSIDPPVACADCALRDFCIPARSTPAQSARFDAMVRKRRRVRRGRPLFRSGDPFSAVYAVRTGLFKTRVGLDDGREQVTGFQMPGELLGFDGIGEGTYRSDAVCLDDAEICVLGYAPLTALARRSPELLYQLHRAMSREIVRDQAMMLLLGSMRADERVAAFLQNLAQRSLARGLSPTALVLHMTRLDIGAYLGLTLETVSRCFSRLHDEGIVEVRIRNLRILDPAALARLAPARRTLALD